eukprot:6505777-Pyramimonas_sp.AAC.1
MQRINGRPGHDASQQLQLITQRDSSKPTDSELAIHSSCIGNDQLLRETLAQPLKLLSEASEALATRSLEDLRYPIWAHWELLRAGPPELVADPVAVRLA